MLDYSSLLDRIAERSQADDPMMARPGGLPPTLSGPEIEAAEQRLGFALHPLLAAVYGRLANGGFGPDYQLLSIDKAVDSYLTARRDNAGTAWAWPEGILPVLDWGCGMYACVDCRSDQGTVLLFEPNPGDPDEAWFIDSVSLPAWFEHYIADTGWRSALEEGEEPEDFAPWTGAAARAI